MQARIARRVHPPAVAPRISSIMADSTILITGATGGIGRALVARCARAGGTDNVALLLVARQTAALGALAEPIPGAHILAADLTTEDGAASLAQTLATLPPLHAFAHCVGSLNLKPLHRLSLADWREQLASHLDSSFLVLRSVVASLLERGGSVAGVLCSSVAAQVGLPNHEAVSAGKAGVEGLLRAAATSYADRGLRLNAIAPSLTDTPLTAGFLRSPAAREAMAAQHPLGRIGTPDDQAAAMQWLMSAESAWISGQVLSVDGGLGLLRPRR